MAKREITKLNSKELRDVIIHFIENNKYLQEKNDKPVALGIEGDAGLGKTSLVRQVANELNLNFVKLNLSQLEDIGDLVGFPVRQFELEKEGKKEWIDEQMVESHLNSGYKSTGKNRTTNCPPDWLAGQTEGGILLLDDYSRANSRFMQATMELINEQTYGTWSLPKGWTIILTTNPDNGEYHVTALDDAQKTRFIEVEMKFDKDCWAEWAENTGLDGRAINFVLKHPELLTDSKKKSATVNPRSMTTFFKSVSKFDDFSKHLDYVHMLGEGSVGPEVTNLFTMFINNKLDKLISPEDILTKDEAYVKGQLKAAIGEDENYRSDIAAILSTRLTNFSVYFAREGKVDAKVLDRLKMIIKEDIFTKDLTYVMVRDIFKNEKAKFQKLLVDQEIQKILIK
jgi:hypothetical protein